MRLKHESANSNSWSIALRFFVTSSPMILSSFPSFLHFLADWVPEQLSPHYPLVLMHGRKHRRCEKAYSAIFWRWNPPKTLCPVSDELSRMFRKSNYAVPMPKNEERPAHLHSLGNWANKVHTHFYMRSKFKRSSAWILRKWETN